MPLSGFMLMDMQVRRLEESDNERQVRQDAQETPHSIYTYTALFLAKRPNLNGLGRAAGGSKTTPNGLSFYSPKTSASTATECGGFQRPRSGPHRGVDRRA